MRISFDLDETLFVKSEKISAEPKLKFPLSLIYKERLRYRAPKLMKKINESGMELWIYTTSFRSIPYIRNYFKCYGVKIARIINGQIHQEEVQKDNNAILPSKMPGKYRINIHVDDDISVKQNGDIYGFKVFSLNDENKTWVEELWRVIEELQRNAP